MEITKKTIIRNIYWSLIGKVVNLLAALLVGIFVARYLGPKQYGLMNYVVSFVSLFLILATFGFDNIEIREEAKNTEEKDCIIGTTFLIRLILSIITITIISVAAYINETDCYTFILILVYSISVLITPFNVIRNHFTALVQNEYIVKVGIFSTLISCAIKVILLFHHASLIWFVISLVFDTFVLALGYCYTYNKKIGKIRNWKFQTKWAKLMLKQSFPLLLSGAAAMIFLQIDQVMIGNMIDKPTVGYFSVASKFVEVSIYLPTIIIQTISPVLIRIKKENFTKYKEKAQYYMDIITWASFFTSIIICCISYYLVDFTFGDAYLPAVIPLQILSFKLIGVSLNIVSGQILIIDEKQKYFVIRSLCGCIVCVLFNYLCIPHYGISGVALVAIATQFAAGYIIHAFIPSYRYVFKMQTKTLLYGWKSSVLFISSLIKKYGHHIH